jgi:predicted GTPase
MEIEKLEKYLQTYLDDVISPNMNQELVGEEDEPIKMNVFQILKGSYQPPIYHAFIDVEPNWDGSYRKKIENDVNDFMKILSIPNRLKIHWNKRPAFKGPETPKPFYGTQEK